MLARVSNLEAFRQWREDEDQIAADLVARLTTFEPSPAMLAGTAFHKALEEAQEGEHDTLTALGYTFHLKGGEIALPAIRELRAAKDYGPLRVTGCVDVLDGRRVDDHKTTSRFDPDRYLAGYSWRYYLDLFEADTFRWNVFEVKEIAPLEYEVKPPQFIEQRRYPGMERDCAKLAADFYEFASIYLPDHNAMPEAA